MKAATTKRNGPRYWKAKEAENAIEGLARMKSLEAQLIKKRKLKSVTLSDGCVICATKERLAYLMEIHCSKQSTTKKTSKP